jgi:dTDP-4-dehydrorhamnose reductase
LEIRDTADSEVCATASHASAYIVKAPGNKIVVIGAGGRLGAALIREYAQDFNVVGFTHSQLDLGSATQLHSALDPLDFELIINTAAQTNVDRCETHPDEAFAINAEAPRVLASICREKNARFIHVSTDYVFDGRKRTPYTEQDRAEPISVYGESKREGERRVLEANDRSLVLRVSWVFGPDRPSFVDWAIKQARQHEEVKAIADKWATPTYTLDLAQLLKPLLVDRDVTGLLQLANGGECSWQEYAQWAIDCCRAEGIPLKTEKIEAAALRDMKSFIAQRPIYSVLSSEKYFDLTGQRPRDWRDAVAAYVQDYVK